ncbi:MAG: hypothetical protein WC773_03740 [Patescibacteria group bacterium]|jgi:hypothetical protein
MADENTTTTQNLDPDDYLLELETDPESDCYKLIQDQKYDQIMPVLAPLPLKVQIRVCELLRETFIDQMRHLINSTPADIYQKITATITKTSGDDQAKLAQIRDHYFVTISMLMTLKAPSTQKRLVKIAAQKYNADTSYRQIDIEQQLAETMLRALPNIAETETDYIQKIAEFTGVEMSDQPFTDFVSKAVDALYYIALLDDLLLLKIGTQTGDDKIDLTVLQSQGVIEFVRMVMMLRDPFLQALYSESELNTSVAAMPEISPETVKQTPAPETETTNYDIV